MKDKPMGSKVKKLFGDYSYKKIVIITKNGKTTKTVTGSDEPPTNEDKLFKKFDKIMDDFSDLMEEFK